MNEADELKHRQAELETLLEQIDHEQDLVDGLETEIELVRESLSPPFSLRQSVKLPSPPP
jgi:cell shape-determining protein MreC